MSGFHWTKACCPAQTNCKSPLQVQSNPRHWLWRDRTARQRFLSLKQNRWAPTEWIGKRGEGWLPAHWNCFFDRIRKKRTLPSYSRKEQYIVSRENLLIGLVCFYPRLFSDRLQWISPVRSKNLQNGQTFVKKQCTLPFMVCGFRFMSVYKKLHARPWKRAADNK